MKFSAILFASLVAASYGFSPVMKSKPSTSLFVEPTSGPVDKTMEGIDSDPNTFDPTGGANPALTRNNKGEVWNLQVSRCYVDFVMGYPKALNIFVAAIPGLNWIVPNLLQWFSREPVLDATANQPP